MKQLVFNFPKLSIHACLVIYLLYKFDFDFWCLSLSLVATGVRILQCSTPVTEGQNATLYCNATGNPAPNITWIKENSGKTLSHNKTLFITAVKRNKAGSYLCFAWNGIGNTHNRSCTVDVYCK